MDHSRYLELIRTESDLLLAAVERNPGAPVPSCPGWTTHDVLRHVGEVYEHKILCIELGRDPGAGERTPPPSVDAELGPWFIALRDALLGRLAARGPEQKSHTWFPPDQSVGFWYRRMALETAVHRADAELAGSQVTPVEPELASDGVEELLGFLTYDFGDRPTLAEGADRTVGLRCDGRQWAVTLRVDRVDRAAEGTALDAWIEGEPGELLLHLWNRHPKDASSVTRSGDPAALAALVTRLRQETQ